MASNPATVNWLTKRVCRQAHIYRYLESIISNSETKFKILIILNEKQKCKSFSCRKHQPKMFLICLLQTAIQFSAYKNSSSKRVLLSTLCLDRHRKNFFLCRTSAKQYLIQFVFCLFLTVLTYFSLRIIPISLFLYFSISTWNSKDFGFFY